MSPAGIYRKYRGRINRLMRRIARTLKEAGHKVEGPYAGVDDPAALRTNAE